MRATFATALSLLLLAASAVRAEPAANVDIVALARETVTHLARDDYRTVRASFSPKLQGAMSEQDLRKVWTGLVKKVGPLQSTGEPVSRMNGKLRAVAIPAGFERGKVEIEVVFNDAGQIAGLLLHRKRRWLW